MVSCGKSPQSMTGGGPADRKFNLPAANALLDRGTLPSLLPPSPRDDLPLRALAVFTKVRKRPPCTRSFSCHVATLPDSRPCHC